jgi:hypothetical protein
MLKGAGLGRGRNLVGSRLTLVSTSGRAESPRGRIEATWRNTGHHRRADRGQPTPVVLEPYWAEHVGHRPDLDTASRIEANDESSWFGGWLKTADRVRRVAENSLAAGHKGKASEPYLRAATYYRGALIHPQGLEHGGQLAPRVADGTTYLPLGRPPHHRPLTSGGWPPQARAGRARSRGP